MRSNWTQTTFTVKVLDEVWTVMVRDPKIMASVAAFTGLDLGGDELYGLTVPIVRGSVVNRMYIGTNIVSKNILIDTIAHEVFHMVYSYAGAEEELQARHCGRATASLIRRMVPASGLDR